MEESFGIWILNFNVFRKEIQSAPPSSPHSSIKYSYILSCEFCFLLSLSVFFSPAQFFTYFNYFFSLLLFQSYRKCARIISNPSACVQFLTPYLLWLWNSVSARTHGCYFVKCPSLELAWCLLVIKCRLDHLAGILQDIFFPSVCIISGDT